MRTFEWPIEDIVDAHPDLYLEHCAVMAVALISRLSASPCEFVVECEGFGPDASDGETSFLVKVSWTGHTMLKAQRVLYTEQSKPIIERAAVALAALLFAKLVPDGQMRVTRQGDRADYWLPPLQCALEVSGTTTPRELTRRHRIKVSQVLSNPLRWNGYVVVCCFAASRRIIRWSYHEQEVNVDASSKG
ncbi:MAG: hypothetical protein L0229_22315 [Blastocatellia bacterium]|nr:hypothetical protein [Blastocatellia bacterium]